MVRLQNINKIYPNGFHALKNINLEVQKGEIYGIIGYSGAGKSTLIRIINLLESPSNGEIIVNNRNLSALKPNELRFERQKIGMIFQHFNLLSARSVFGNIAFALEIAKWDKHKINARVMELLDLVDLSDKKDYAISQLSGGQKQRVAIARALANEPHLLLCDEATSALDTKTTKSILDLLKDIQHKLNLTVILITHQIEVVKAICNKMCVINNGQIVESGFVKEVFGNPQHSVTKDLIQNTRFQPNIRDLTNVYKLIFTGPNAQNPLISQLCKKFSVDINILSGRIDELESSEVGHLIVKFIGNFNEIQQALDWLKNQGLNIISAQSEISPINPPKSIKDSTKIEKKTESTIIKEPKRIEIVKRFGHNDDLRAQIAKNKESANNERVQFVVKKVKQ